MDFTIKKYIELLESLNTGKYTFQTITEFLEQSENKTIILRHDVERNYNNALQMAQIQYKLGILGTYYFRFSKKHFQKDVVEEIAHLGHEIGYHYDDLAKCKGDYEKAIKRFEENLKILRKIAPVKTICMDGSPLSKYDNKDLWKKYNYHDFGILSEPYFDINFNEVGYLTDTGRRWDGEKVSVRDKVPDTGSRIPGGERSRYLVSGTCPERSRRAWNLSFHTTTDIINAAYNGQLPNKIMLTFHPQRWTDKPLPWVKELVWQNFKNQVKRLLVK
jgi:hypothetical protein